MGTFFAVLAGVAIGASLMFAVALERLWTQQAEHAVDIDSHIRRYEKLHQEYLMLLRSTLARDNLALYPRITTHGYTQTSSYIDKLKGESTTPNEQL
jgi:hypothetical protein